MFCAPPLIDVRPVAVDLEHHAGNGVGELEEVARHLRHGLDLLLRDRRADFRGAHFVEPPAGDGDFLHRCFGRFDRAARRGEIERRGGGNTQRSPPFRCPAPASTR